MYITFFALNILFNLVHASLVFFLSFGLFMPKLRPAHLIATLCVTFSWFGLGYFKGFGYCALTDYHWQVREQLGLTMEYSTYIPYLLYNLSFRTLAVPQKLVDIVSTINFLVLSCASFFLNRQMIKFKVLKLLQILKLNLGYTTWSSYDYLPFSQPQADVIE